MTNNEYSQFEECRASFRSYCINTLRFCDEEYAVPSSPATPTKSILAKEIEKTIEPNLFYNVETPIVYNHSLDSIEGKNEIKLILVGDNPGKEEQRHINQRYLVGQAGRIAEGFFARNKELKIDFRKNVIILNKSVIHTPKTLGLKKLIKANFIVKDNTNIEDFLIQDEIKQAKLALKLQTIFNCPLWIIGYSELGEKGIFTYYANIIKKEIKESAISNLFLYQHFSMNCFIKQLKTSYDKTLSLGENLKALGSNNRKRILML